MTATGYGAYRRVQTETATPGELVVLLYDALLRNLARAESALTAGDREVAHEPLVRAQEIVLELISSLDLEAGPIAGELYNLYQYWHRRLIDANVGQDAESAREVARLAMPIRDAWAHAARTAGHTGAARP